jgi:hypothetical protein
LLVALADLPAFCDEECEDAGDLDHHGFHVVARIDRTQTHGGVVQEAELEAYLSMSREVVAPAVVVRLPKMLHAVRHQDIDSRGMPLVGQGVRARIEPTVLVAKNEAGLLQVVGYCTGDSDFARIGDEVSVERERRDRNDALRRSQVYGVGAHQDEAALRERREHAARR